MRKALFSSILATAAALVLASCNSLVLPPGLSRVGDVLQNKTSIAASPSAVYSLMAWYKEEYQDAELPRHWQSYVENNLASSLADINSQWQSTVIDKSQGLVVSDAVTFMLLKSEAISERTDWKELHTLINDLQTLVAPPHTIVVPLDECLVDHFWKGRSLEAKESFCAWAQGRRLVIPPPANLNPQNILDKLAALENALELKKTICDAMDQAQSLCADGKYLDALNSLTTLRSRLAENNACLAPLENDTTLEKLDALIADTPHRCIHSALATFHSSLDDFGQSAEKTQNKSLKVLDEALAKLETRATAFFFIVVSDRRFDKAWAASQSQVASVVASFTAHRTRIWKGLLDEDLAARHYWDALSSYRLNAEMLALEHHSQFGMYPLLHPEKSEETFSAAIVRTLQRHLLDRLPGMMAFLLEQAGKAQKLNGQNGYALSLCIMAEQMAEILHANETPELKRLLAQCATLKAELAKHLEDSVLKRTFTVTDMSSALPGLGLTCTLDTRHQLETFLKNTGMDRHLTLSSGTTAVSPFGYLLYDGVVADFDGKETVERHNTRKVISVGEIRKSSNPEAKANPAAPPAIYTQEVSEQLVHMREIERIAHVRLFATLRGPGFTTQVEVNEFYSKCFIIEESHPFNDIRVVDVLKTYDLAKLPCPDTAPTLRYDRIWTAGEMLDWARKDAIKVFALKIFFHVGQFPFLLENNARQNDADGNLAAATEQWALCHLATLNTLIDQNGVNILADTTHPMAKCYEDCVVSLRRQRAAFIELKKHCRDNLIDVANRYMKANLKQ